MRPLRRLPELDDLGSDAVPQNSAVDLLPQSLICREPIYHYTSATGFLGLASNHELWATEAFGLNDVSELRHGWNFIRVWLSKQGEDDVIDEMRSFTPEEGDEGWLDQVFMCCASTLPDDASQWRLYADVARGYAVELDPRVALAVKARTGAFPDGEPPKMYSSKVLGAMLRDHAEVTPWMHVMYTSDQKTKALEDLHASLTARFADFDRMFSEATSEEDVAYIAQDRQSEVRACLGILAQCMKSEAFSGEGEVRAVATLLFDEHAEFRATGYGVVRYVKLVTRQSSSSVFRVAIEKPIQLPVKSVRLGPGQLAQNSRAAANSLLARFDYKARIHESTATLR